MRKTTLATQSCLSGFPFKSLQIVNLLKTVVKSFPYAFKKVIFNRTVFKKA